MPLDEDHALAALGMAVAGVNMFSAANPSIFTIRQLGVGGDVKVRDIRHGEAFAAVTTVGLGILTATIMDSTVPLIMAVGVSALMVGMYEYALATAEDRKDGEG